MTTNPHDPDASTGTNPAGGAPGRTPPPQDPRAQIPPPQGPPPQDPRAQTPPPQGPPPPTPSAQAPPQPSSARVPPPWPPAPVRPPLTEIKTPLGWVIAAVILFWPTAIVALLASHRAARAVGAGDVEGARRESATATRWGIVSVCVGAALLALSIVMSVVWAIVVAIAVVGSDDGWNVGTEWSDGLPFDWDDDAPLPGQPSPPGRDGTGG